MKTFIKSIYLILFFLFLFVNTTKTFARDANTKYSQEEISNYFLGSVTLSQNNALESFKYPVSEFFETYIFLVTLLQAFLAPLS